MSDHHLPPRCSCPQNDHNHPKPGHVRGQPGFGGGFYRQGSGARQRQRRMDDEEDTEEEEEEEEDVAAQHAEEGVGGEAGEGGEGDEMQQEDAVAALATMKYSPVVPAMLGAAPQDTPASLLPIPASLRASEDPEDPAANGWAVQAAAGAAHRLQRSSGPPVGGVGGSGGAGDDSDLSGWRFCGVCGMRLDASWPLATWHMQQHLQAQRAAGALAAHARRFSTLGRTPAAARHLGRPRTAARRSPGLCTGLTTLPRNPPKLPARGWWAGRGSCPPAGCQPAARASHPPPLPLPSPLALLAPQTRSTAAS